MIKLTINQRVVLVSILHLSAGYFCSKVGASYYFLVCIPMSFIGGYQLGIIKKLAQKNEK